MKRIIFAAATAAALSISSIAMAAPTLGFGPTGTVTPGGRSDSLLSRAAIESAVLAGIREAGVAIDSASHNVPAVSIDYATLYVPDALNMRVLTAGIALRDEVIVRGKGRIVALCDWGSTTWTAGDSEGANVQRILDGARSLGRTFASKCLK